MELNCTVASYPDIMMYFVQGREGGTGGGQSAFSFKFNCLSLSLTNPYILRHNLVQVSTGPWCLFAQGQRFMLRLFVFLYVL